VRNPTLALTLVALLAGAFAVAAAPPSLPKPGHAAAGRVTFRGGDGATIETAVVVVAADESSGVDAEYAWLRDRFPGCKRKGQALRNVDGRMYDDITIEDAEGGAHTIHFDISAFFGKL
jgi:hypothetical protein